MARVAIYLLVFMLQLPAAASPRGLSGYSLRVWHTQDGLPEETVQAFAQTPDRYLWIGTSGGLVRFDGAQFVVFDRENTPALRENSVFTLVVSSDGVLWIGTDGGGIATYQRGVFRSYSNKEGLTNPFVRAICEDRNKVVWVGTDDGLFRFSGDKLTRIDGQGGVPEIAVHAIVQDSHGKLWAGGSTLLMLDGNTATEYRFQGGFGENRIKSILETGDGAIWAGTVSGLQHKGVHDASFTRISGITSTVRVLSDDLNGTLWIGTIGEGILAYQSGRISKLTAPNYLPSGTILSLFKDIEQNIWVGTQTGLVRLSATPVSTLPILDAEDSDFSTISQDRDGSLWVASTHLHRFIDGKATSFEFRGPLAGIKVRNVFRDRAGVLWVGTDGRGAFRIKGSQIEQFTTRKGLVNDFIRAFLESRDGSIWIGTDEGVSRWKSGEFTNYRVPDGLSYFSIRALLEDRAGDLWIGTERGVSRLHQGVFVRDPVVERLQTEKVWAIHEDPEGGLWFGTRGGGLFRWKSQRLTAYTTAQGLASNGIYHILEDRNGRFWMTGLNGIFSITRSDLDRIADVPSYRPAVTLYGISDGLETTQMQGGTQPAGSLTSNGEIWFPSNKGPVRILPEETVATDVPSAVIERVLADGRDAPLSGKLALPPGDGKLEVHYSAIRLRSQERIRFKYKLEGFDNEWTEANQRRVAYYTNLPAGQYHFRVAAFEMSDPEKVSEAGIAFSWQPHFYRAAWFYLLCLLALAAAAWVAHEFRMGEAHARFQAVLEERGRVAREMHDTLIQGCGSVSALLEASSALGDGAPEMKRELLEFARDQVRTTIDEARNAVWNLRHQAASSGIGSMLSQMAQQVSIESRIRIVCETTGKPSALDPPTEHDILMIAREALHNAVQHAQPHNVQLRLCFETRKVRVFVMDDGCGFEPSAVRSNGAHYGLIGMRERVERLGGRFVVTSKAGQGTQIEATIPT